MRISEVPKRRPQQEVLRYRKDESRPGPQILSGAIHEEQAPEEESGAAGAPEDDSEQPVGIPVDPEIRRKLVLIHRVTPQRRR